MISRIQESEKRYLKDVELYQMEIADCKKKLEKETDKYNIKHLEKLLLDSQRALNDVLKESNKPIN